MICSRLDDGDLEVFEDLRGLHLILIIQHFLSPVGTPTKKCADKDKPFGCGGDGRALHSVHRIAVAEYLLLIQHIGDPQHKYRERFSDGGKINWH